MLRTLEPQKGAENKNAEADFKNPCSYKMKSVYATFTTLIFFYKNQVYKNVRLQIVKNLRTC